MLDDLDELRAFRALLAAGSVGAAAAELGIEASTVRARLASLEGRAGVALVRLDDDAADPTEQGARLRLDVERALDALAASEQWLTSGRDEPVGTLHVSAPLSFGRRHVAPVLARLAAEHARLAVSLSLGEEPGDAAQDGCDVAIRMTATPETAAHARKLVDNRRVLVASSDHLDHAGRPATPSDLDAHSLLRRGGPPRPWHLRGPAGKAAVVATRARLTASSSDVLRDWALAGHGILFASAIDVAADLAAGRLERVLPQWFGRPAPVVAVCSSDDPPRKTRLFLDAMAESLAEVVTQLG